MTELQDAIIKINRIIKSNAFQGQLRVCDDELHELISLCEMAEKLNDNTISKD